MSAPAMRTRRHRYLPSAVGAAKEATATAPVSDLPTSETGASIVIPFLPFDIVPLGLVTVSDTHRDSEQEKSWVTRDGSEMTQNRAIAT